VSNLHRMVSQTSRYQLQHSDAVAPEIRGVPFKDSQGGPNAECLLELDPP
jgi:hypothetical protein